MIGLPFLLTVTFSYQNQKTKIHKVTWRRPNPQGTPKNNKSKFNNLLFLSPTLQVPLYYQTISLKNFNKAVVDTVQVCDSSPKQTERQADICQLDSPPYA